MSYTLYNRVGSGGFAVEAALAMAGQTFELITIDSAPSTDLPDSFRETNPWRQVPVLITTDGTTVTETAAILIYIAQQHPGGEIGPEPGSPGYASLLRWLVFMSTNIYEGTLRRIYPERFTTDPDGYEGIRKAAIERNSAAFSLLENTLAADGYLLGRNISVADVYLAMLFAWHPRHEEWPLCRALTHRVAAHAVIAPLWRRNFDHRMKTKWGR